MSAVFFARLKEFERRLGIAEAKITEMEAKWVKLAEAPEPVPSQVGECRCIEVDSGGSVGFDRSNCPIHQHVVPPKRRGRPPKVAVSG